jgi:fructose-1,6-bisphosphatase I
MNTSRVKTLGQFIIEKQADFAFAKGELSRLLRDIGIASKIVNREVSKAGIAGILGDVGEINVQGENVKNSRTFCRRRMLRHCFRREQRHHHH